MATEAARLVINITTNADTATKNLRGLKGETDNVGKAFNTLKGIAIGAFFVAVGRKVFDLARNFVSAASEAEETANKFNVVFSGVGDDAAAAANRLSTSFGFSQEAAQSLLASTGDLLTGFGFTQESALDLSSQVNELAADLVSFTNFSGGTEVASQALTKALLGETEQAKSLGIVIRQNSKEFRDQVEEIQETTGATEQQARSQAILNQIIAQSQNAIGDFARSQASFANQSRIAQATIDDLQSILGQGLLPIANAGVTLFNSFREELLGAANAVKDFITSAEGASAIGDFLGTIAGAISVIGQIGQTVFEGLADVIDSLIAPLEEFASESEDSGVIFSILGGIVQAGSAAFRVLAEGVNLAVTAIVDLARIVTSVGDVIGSFFDGLARLDFSDFEDKIEEVGDTIESFADNLSNNFGSLIETTVEEFNTFGEGAEANAERFREAFEDASEQVSSAVSTALVNAGTDSSTQATETGSDLGEDFAEGFGSSFVNELFGNTFQRFEEFQEAVLEKSEQDIKQRIRIERELDEAREEAHQKELDRIREEANQAVDSAQTTLGFLTEISSNLEEQEIERLRAQGVSEEELDRKRKEFARNQAIREKALGIFNATIDTAQAVVAFLAQGNIAGSIFAGIQGAAQIAAIASQPIPAAQFGGSFVVPPGNERDSGLLRVNQGEQVNVTPVRQTQNNSGISLRPGDRATFFVDGRSFDAVLQDRINSGNVTVNRRGVVRAS